jgi:putative endonuclease
MATHNLLGKIGEEEACRYLIRKGYTLLERNWRVGHLELDIIAECYGEIIFVEVKTRSNEHFASALSAVDEEKLQNLRHAAGYYLSIHQLDQPIRFDVITVVGTKKPFAITHYVGGKQG